MTREPLQRKAQACRELAACSLDEERRRLWLNRAAKWEALARQGDQQSRPHGDTVKPQPCLIAEKSSLPKPSGVERPPKERKIQKRATACLT